MGIALKNASEASSIVLQNQKGFITTSDAYDDIIKMHKEIDVLNTELKQLKKSTRKKHWRQHLKNNISNGWKRY